MRETYRVLAATAVLALGACATTAQAPNGSNLSQTDVSMITAAYQLIHFDLQECAALQTREPGPQVATVSTEICADAAHFEPILEQVAAKHNVTLPNHLTYELNAQYAILAYRPWPNVDMNYLQDQISSHQQALAVFEEEEADESSNPDIKSVSRDAIPIVQGNLERLRRTLTDLNNTPAS